MDRATCCHKKICGKERVKPSITLGTLGRPSRGSERFLVRMPGNRTHAFFYDNLYELVQETHPDFGTISYGYDPNGNRASERGGG